MANATIIITAKNQAKAAFDQVGKQTEKIAQKMMKWDGIFRALLVAGPIAKMGMALFRAGTHTEELGRKAAELREKFKDAAEPLADGLQKALLAAIPIAERLAASLKKVGAEIAYNAAWWGARLSGSKNPAEEARQTLEADARDRANRKMLAEREKYVDYYREREAEAILAGEKEEAEKIKRLEQQYKDLMEKEKQERIDAIEEMFNKEAEAIEALYDQRIDNAKRVAQVAADEEKARVKDLEAAKMRFTDKEFRKREREQKKAEAREKRRFERALEQAERGIKSPEIDRALAVVAAQKDVSAAAQDKIAAEERIERLEKERAEKIAEVAENTKDMVSLLRENLKPGEY